MSLDASYFSNATDRRPGKPERLFRAAIDAYCALPRPTRAEADRLDDLALPLICSVSPEALRFAAAALSEAPRAPAGVVRKLANEPPHISAPLLIRADALADIDLIALIGRHGLPHARVIARRKDLNPDIRALIETLDSDMISGAVEANTDDAPRKRPHPLEEANDRLRSMMVPLASYPARHMPLPRTAVTSTTAYLALRDTVLAGYEGAYEDALCELGGIDARQAHAICRTADIAAQLGLLRFLGLSAEQMFLVMACRQPQHASTGQAAAALLKRYAAISYAWSKELVLALRRERLPQAVNANTPSASWRMARG